MITIQNSYWISFVDQVRLWLTSLQFISDTSRRECEWPWADSGLFLVWIGGPVRLVNNGHGRRMNRTLSWLSGMAACLIIHTLSITRTRARSFIHTLSVGGSLILLRVKRSPCPLSRKTLNRIVPTTMENFLRKLPWCVAEATKWN